MNGQAAAVFVSRPARHACQARRARHASSLADWIFPKDLYCLSCGRPLPLPCGEVGPRLALCGRCKDEIEWITGRVCAKCGRPLSDENPADHCYDCRAQAAHIFGKGLACALYAGRAKGLVQDMKYRGRAWHADTLAALMAARYFASADADTGELPYYDYVLAAPMNAAKRALRGFDQAALLAKGLARRIGVPYLKDGLVRTRKTDVMSSLSADARRQNLAGAFSVACDMMKIAGKRILLTDDVYTTGSTADACAEALLSAGAEGADMIVFAIGADMRRAQDRPAVVESPSQLRAKGPT